MLVVKSRRAFAKTIVSCMKWRAPSSSATFHSLPFGLKSFAKPDVWLREIDARSCVEWLITDYIDATSFVDFAKSYPASQSSWARRANYGLLYYWLEPFKLCAKFILQQYNIFLQAIISENYMHVIPDAIKLGFICITKCI